MNRVTVLFIWLVIGAIGINAIIASQNTTNRFRNMTNNINNSNTDFFETEGK